jgi:hypothetical protein
MEVKYPIFLECAEFTLDEFWICQFTQLAKGKSPRGVHLHDEYMTVYLGRERVCLKFDDPASLTNEVIHTFWKLGIMSKNDEKEYNEIITQIRESLCDSMTDWKSLKSKSIKKTLISNYVQSLPYDIKDRLEIHALLNIHLIFNNLTDKNVVLKDGRIVNVIGLINEDGKWVFNI